MAIRKLEDVQAGNKYGRISLFKLTGLVITDIAGYFSDEFGNLVFSIRCIELSDGTNLTVGGEHDIAYIEDDIPGTSEEEIQALYDEENE